LVGSKQAIAAPPATPPRYSLLFVANQIQNGDDWMQGVRWAPEQTLGGGVLALDCFGSTDSMTPDTNSGWAEAEPFSVWAEDHCSTFGFLARDYEARALRQLEAMQSFQVAHEFWTGDLAQSASLDNHWLTEDPKILTSTALAPAEALAIVDMGLGQMLGGRRGMIHVSMQVLDELAVNDAITLNGQLWLSPAGTPIVADAGYPGDEPDAGDADAHQWIYGTSMVQYRLGEVMLVPGTLDEARAQATARATNLTTVFAQRLVLLQWDSEIPIGTSGKEGVLAAETTTAAFAAL
jgi:hypothetical protein